MTLESRLGRSRGIIAVVVAILIAAAGYMIWQQSKSREVAAQHDREEELRSALADLRGAIRQFHTENGRYPSTLEEMIPTQLARIPIDPITGSASTWRPITEETVVQGSDFAVDAGPAAESYIIDVQSGAGAPWSGY
ncbi:MAG TPA: hypothetical protein VF701_05805 [Thermoanaerobaculia bacterium]